MIYDLLRLIRLVSERQPEATEEDMKLYEEELDELETLVDQKYGAETGVEKEVGDDADVRGLAESGKKPGKRGDSDSPFSWRER